MDGHAERRFMLLLACALGALAVLAIATSRPTHRAASAVANAAQGLASPRHALAAADVRPGTPSRLRLGSLLSADAGVRLPQLRLRRPPAPDLLAHSQIVSYYGSTYTPDLGILGEGSPEEIAGRLEAHAARYDELNGDTGVIPAMHLIYAVAQYHPTDNGLFLQYAGDGDVRRFIELTAGRDMLLFLDLQIGRSSVEAELQRVLPYLRYPNVHLALDPEFAVTAPEVPGTDLGSLSAADVDEAQAALQSLVERAGLPPKLLIVHQFVDSMLVDAEAIERFPDVELIIDMDGYGPAEIKRVKYEHYASLPYATHAAIKLFFQHDPDLMSEAEVLSLVPGPSVVIYQ